MGSLEEVCQDVVTSKIEEDPEWAKIIAQTMKTLNSGEFPKRYLDVLFQKSWAKKLDMFEAYCFANIHTAIKTGLLAVFQIPIGEFPVADSRKNEMNRRLEKMPFPFEGTFFGGTSGEDGYIYHSKPVNALLNNSGQVGFVIVPPIMLNNGERLGIPLEVGTTSIYKTYDYLHNAWSGGGRGGGIARWPYGQDRITIITPVFHTTESDKFQELVKQVHGDFFTLPNPWEDEWTIPKKTKEDKNCKEIDQKREIKKHPTIEETIEIHANTLLPGTRLFSRQLWHDLFGRNVSFNSVSRGLGQLAKGGKVKKSAQTCGRGSYWEVM